MNIECEKEDALKIFDMLCPSLSKEKRELYIKIFCNECGKCKAET